MRYLLLIITLSLLGWPGHVRAFTEIKLVQGVAEIPDESTALSKVNGEALVLRDVLATPAEFDAQAAAAIAVPYPQLWQNLFDYGMKRTGEATYRFTLIIPESMVGKPLGIWFPRAMGPSTFWMNGQRIIHHDFGPDGDAFFDKSPGHNRYYFTPRERTLIVTIQIFNRYIHTGGFFDKLLIGPAAELRSYSIRLVTFDFLVFGVLIFSGLYHLWIYTFRRKFPVYRDLGLFFIAVVVRIVCTGSAHWLAENGINEVLNWKIGWISYYAALILGTQTLKAIYPDETPALIVRVIRIVGGSSIALVLLTPLGVSYVTLPVMQFMTVALAGPMLWSLFRAYMKRRPGTLVLLPASILLLSMGFIEIYNSIKSIDQTFSLLGIGVLLFSLGASVFQSMNFDHTFRMVERQTRGIETLNAKLLKQAEILERRIHQQTEELATLLHNLPEGVLLLESNGRGGLSTGAYFSQSMQTILGSAAIDIRVVNRFLHRTQLNSDQKDQVQATLQAIVGEDAISFELNADNLPKEVQVIGDQGPETYLCAWAPVVINASIRSVLLILVDVSAERSVFSQYEQEQQIFDRMIHLLTVEPDSLVIFMQEAEALLQRLRETQDHQLLLRDLHTLKGLARSFGLLALARIAHDAEGRLIRHKTFHRQALEQIWAAHHEALQTLRIDFHNDPSLEKEEDIILVAGQQLERLNEPPSELWQETWRDFLQHLFIRSDRLILAVLDGLNEVAAQLGKPMPELVIEGGEVGIRRMIQGKLLGGLNHILRNALDHGLELPGERIMQGKREQGSIFVTLQYREKILIEVYDDGRGLNLPRIRERAIEKGLATADQLLSDEQIAQFVFAPGFSTKLEANEISGRGIGMDAVQAVIRQMGGQIRIVWRSRRSEEGFRQGIWSIHLPRRFGFKEVPQ